MSFQPADAAGSPVVEAVKSLSCEQVTLPNISSYESRFGIPADQWGSDAETALEYKIDSCYSQNMKGTSVQNEALQNKRKDVFVSQLNAGKAPQADLDQHKMMMANAKPKNGYVPSAQELLIGSQLFVEKHCPQIKPNEEAFESIDQSSSETKLFYPPTMTAAVRDQGAKVLQHFETQTNTGYIAGSPLDYKMKCGMFLTMLVNGAGLYEYTQP